MLVLGTVPGEPQPQDAVLGVLGLCPPNFPQILARPAKIQLLHLAPAKVVMMQNGNGKEEEARHLHCQQQLISWRRLVSPGSVFFFVLFFFSGPPRSGWPERGQAPGARGLLGVDFSSAAPR